MNSVLREPVLLLYVLFFPPLPTDTSTSCILYTHHSPTHPHPPTRPTNTFQVCTISDQVKEVAKKLRFRKVSSGRGLMPCLLVTSLLCRVVPPLPFDLHCSCPFDLDVIFFGRGTAASRTHGHTTCHPHPVLCLPHRARCRRAHCVSLACLILVSGGVFPVRSRSGSGMAGQEQRGDCAQDQSQGKAGRGRRRVLRL